MLTRFITVQHRGIHPNNLKRIPEIRETLGAHAEQLLTKRTAERLMQLGQACVDEDAQHLLDGIDAGALLRVATDALNTLVFVLVEGVDALDSLRVDAHSEPEARKRAASYLRQDYAARMIGAGHPDSCEGLRRDVPYGDVRDLAPTPDAPLPGALRVQSAVIALLVCAIAYLLRALLHARHGANAISSSARGEGAVAEALGGYAAGVDE